MMAQYKAVKAQYPDALMMMRLGDFHEMIGEDAKRKELDERFLALRLGRLLP